MMSPLLEERVDGVDVVLPSRDLAAERLPPFGGQRVVARPPIVVRHTPLGAHGTAVFEAVQRLVQRGVDDAELAGGAVVDPLAEREAVHRAGGEGAEDEQVERAVEEVFRVAGHSPSTRWKEKSRTCRA